MLITLINSNAAVDNARVFTSTCFKKNFIVYQISLIYYLARPTITVHANLTSHLLRSIKIAIVLNFRFLFGKCLVKSIIIKASIHPDIVLVAEET